METSQSNLDYINSTDYKKVELRLNDLKSILEDNHDKLIASRKLRFADVDVEAEREAQRLAPDELYVPQHIIDTNIRQEQSSYIQYITESPRAVILEDLDDSNVDLSVLEKDLTKKLRFDGWQLSSFANIDGFQSMGYGVKEVVYDKNLPGHVGEEYVQYGDFGFVCDTRDLQEVEMVARTYYYTRTKLIELSTMKPGKSLEDLWNREQVDKIVDREPLNVASYDTQNLTDKKEKSLYGIHKVMFRINGVVHVAWTCIGLNDNWLRAPRPLYLGRRSLVQENKMQTLIRTNIQRNPVPPSQEVYETKFPYFLYPYLISENDTIMELKGRVFLDQDSQEAVSSLLSSTITQARRAAGLYFSKEESDPNDDVLLQKNVFFKNGALINSKVKAMELKAPDPGMFAAIQSLVSTNKAETSRVDFAESNKQKDSRKTAKAIEAAQSMAQTLSTVQVVLFSLALKEQYTYQCEIIKSRVIAGLITVPPSIMPLYQRRWTVKPSGDVDVIQKQQLVNAMMGAWPVIQQTPAGPAFLSDLLEKMFPDNAPKYLKAIQDAQAQQQSQQAQQMQAMMGEVQKLAQLVQSLAKKPELFSDTGRIHAFPIIEQAAEQIEQTQTQQ